MERSAQQVRSWVRSQCLALPDTYRDFPFGPQAEVFRIRGKVFGLLMDRPGVAPGPILNLKAEVEEVPRLVAEHDFVLPGYHMNKRHWISVLFPSCEHDELIASLIEDSYDNVLAAMPARLRPLWARRPQPRESLYPQGYTIEPSPIKGATPCAEQSPARPAAKPPGPDAVNTSTP